MAIEIIPPGASAVVTEKDHGSKHPDRWDLAAQAERNVARVIDEQCDDTAEVVAAVGTGFTADALAFSVAQKQLSDAATATVVGFKDAAATAYQLSGNSLLDSAKNAAAITLQATTNAYEAQVQATANFNALTVQATQNNYQLQLQAQTIAAAAAAQAAECCCELKSLIRDDGQKTRDLINSITEQNLRDRAARAEQSLAAYFAAKVAPVVPVV